MHIVNLNNDKFDMFAKYRRIASEHNIEGNGTIVTAIENSVFDNSFFNATIDAMAKGFGLKAHRIRVFGHELGMNGAQASYLVSIVFFV